MKPILFDKNSTNFTTNGIGRLSDAVFCTVTDEINGQFELIMRYPITGAHYSDIGINSIIVAKHEDSDDLQPFEVYRVTKPINGIVTVNAHHISYRLSKVVCMPFSVSAGANACNDTLQGLKSHAVGPDVNIFTFWTDVHTLGTYNQTSPASLRQRLGGVEGSVLDQFGGEYEFDKFAVKLHQMRGNQNTGYTLKYGKNIIDIEQEEELSNVITGVVPYWTNTDRTETVTLAEKAVYSQYADRYPYHLTVPLDLSDKWENKPTEATLRTAAQAYVNKLSLGLPKVSISVSFIALWQTEEYKDIAPLERVSLGDAVKVYFESLGIEAQARVMGVEYDVLAERYREIQIGSLRSTLARTLSDQEAKTVQGIEAARDYAYEASNNATKWLTANGGYIVAIKNQDGSWQKLAASDRPNPFDPSAQVLLLTQNGLGFSKTGANGYFYQGWTCDGQLLIGTPVNGAAMGYAPSIKIFSGGTQIGKWDKDGIDVGKGAIKGANITLGGAGNADGWLKINNASGQQIGKWDNAGASITGSLRATDSDGYANIANGVMSMQSNTNRSMINMRRGQESDKMYVSFSPTTIYAEKGNLSATVDWIDLLYMLKDYQDHDGHGVFQKWDDTPDGQPIIKA